ncbi:MAG: hypothetical protein GY952_00695 [Rhodobacteraceae bacterium]|nr:hypothetical protein [Paracoccaceae bacterium]
MHSSKIIIGVLAAMALAGCMSPDERTVNRGATGAAVGALATALVSGNILKGAVVGGAVGVLTSKNQQTWE